MLHKTREGEKAGTPSGSAAPSRTGLMSVYFKVPDFLLLLGMGAYCHSAGSTEGGFKIGLWLSLVERLVRDEEAEGSNPSSPTN